MGLRFEKSTADTDEYVTFADVLLDVKRVLDASEQAHPALESMLSAFSRGALTKALKKLLFSGETDRNVQRVCPFTAGASRSCIVHRRVGYGAFPKSTSEPNKDERNFAKVELRMRRRAHPGTALPAELKRLQAMTTDNTRGYLADLL